MSRNKVLIVLLIAAITLFAVSVAASDESYTAGYDTFKEVMKTKPDMANTTAFGTFTLTNKGEVVAEFTNTAKINKNNDRMSSDFTLVLADTEKTGKVFADNEVKVFIDTQNDLYYQFQKSDINETEEVTRTSRRDNFDNKDAMKAHAEVFMDLVMGDYKNDFILSANADGTQSVSFSLSESEIPAALNLMASAAGIKKADYDGDRKSGHGEFPSIPFFEGLENPHDKIPILTDNIKIKGIENSITFDKNKKIQGGTLEINVEGTDKTGTYHDLVIKGYFQLNNIGTTVADTIDLNGKDIETLEIPRHK